VSFAEPRAILLGVLGLASAEEQNDPTSRGPGPQPLADLRRGAEEAGGPSLSLVAGTGDHVDHLLAGRYHKPSSTTSSTP
jgi:hypothetical protein